MKTDLGPYRFWMFDLDGTLIDSLDSTFEALEWATGQHAGRAMTRAEFAQNLGLPEETILANSGFADPADRLLGLYVEHLKKLIAKQIPVFEGIRETLSVASGRNVKIGLFTARGQLATEMLLDVLDLKAFFGDRIVTGTGLSKGKPHPEGLLKLIQRLGAEGQRSFYLGDSPMDMQMARSAGVKALGAGWAFHADKAKLQEAGAENIFSAVAAFRQFVGLD